MKLEIVAQAMNGNLHQATNLGEEQQNVTFVTLDSREVTKDTLFIATPGERVDGHDYLEQAFEKGAICVVVERITPYLEIHQDKAYILVENSFKALKDLAAYYRQTLSIQVVGISGSVGKTSTKEMIAKVLEQKYKVLKTQGNFNNEVGLPLTVLKIEKEHDVAVLEMGISDFGEMKRLSMIARPDLCVFTNIGDCHLEQLGNRKGVLRAKLEMLDYAQANATIILNHQDEHLRTAQIDHQKTILYYGTSLDAQVRVLSCIDLGLLGTKCKFHTDKGEFEVAIKIPGIHMVDNALAACAVGLSMSLTLEEIKAGIEAVTATKGRSNLIQTKHYMVLDDCYNANPVSMKAGLEVLSNTNLRRVAILGDMFELGELEETYHREIGSAFAKSPIEVGIFIGTKAKWMYENAQSNNLQQQTYYFESMEAFFSQAQALLKEQDAILVKASHGMEFTKIVDFLTEKKES